MDQIWQWTWDRCGPRYYWWALCAVAFLVSLAVYSVLVSLPIVASENPGRYLDATAITVFAVVVLVGAMFLPGRRWARLLKQWAAGDNVDRATVLEASYSYA